MHPRLYPFVANGPRCACAHRRVDHIGIHPRWEHLTYDLGCTKCTLCEQYSPMETIDQGTEMRQTKAIHAARERTRAAQQKVMWVDLAGLWVAVVLSAFFRGLFPWVLIPVVALAAGNMTFASFQRWRDGDNGALDLALSVGLVVWVFPFFAALGFGAPTPVIIFLLVLGGGAVCAFLLTTQQDLKRLMRVLGKIDSDHRGEGDEA